MNQLKEIRDRALNNIFIEMYIEEQKKSFDEVSERFLKLEQIALKLISSK